tara:strand:- start:3302 stop:3490 length:189 start_codon:yes stop_codon:yes gene_type:complete
MKNNLSFSMSNQMTNDKESDFFEAKRRLNELEKRVQSPRHWTDGELNIYRMEIKILREKTKS